MPGQHRLRFEGVADGIEPASAIVTGLPSGVIEKNRDAALLSPAALVDAAEAQQGRVLLSRTAPNGITTRREGVIRSTPLKAASTAEDIAGAAVFLAAPASRHVTGETLLVDAGTHLGFASMSMR
jgi:hypothetical protein